MQNPQIPGPQGLAIPEGCERSQGEPGSPRAPAAMPTCSANRNKEQDGKCTWERDGQVDRQNSGSRCDSESKRPISHTSGDFLTVPPSFTATRGSKQNCLHTFCSVFETETHVAKAAAKLDM